VKRILVIALGFKGEVNQRIPLVQELVALGHRVWWLSPLGTPDDQLRSVGISVVELASTEIPTRSLSGEARARIVEDDAAVLAWNRDFYIEKVPVQVEPLRHKLRELAPDVVVLDGTLYAAAIATQLEGIPFANVSAGWMLQQPADFDYPMMQRVRALSSERAALFASYGLSPRFRAWEIVSPHLNVVFSTEAMVGPPVTSEGSPTVQLVGPSVSSRRGDEVPFAWEKLDGRPLVYASFGSRVYWQPDLFAKIAEAAAPLSVQLLFGAGDLAHSEQMRGLPGDPLVAVYVPQLAVLARTAVLVSHVGANSVSEAMYQGVPVLALPITNEEPVQAHFLERAGTGVAFDPRRVTVEQLHSALRALLDPSSPYRSRTAAVQRSYRSANGARAAAELIGELG
jgi:MGT family glycosyltransferase